MAGETATPPASGGVDVQAAVDAAVEKALSGMTAAVGQQITKALEGVTAQQKALEEKLGQIKIPDLAEIDKKIADSVGTLMARQQADAQATAARDKVVAELKAKGVPEELIGAHVPANGKDEELKAGADKAIARWNEVGKVAQPDTPGNGGGAVAGAQGASTPGVGAYVGDAVAKYAASIKLPAA